MADPEFDFVSSAEKYNNEWEQKNKENASSILNDGVSFASSVLNIILPNSKLLNSSSYANTIYSGYEMLSNDYSLEDKVDYVFDVSETASKISIPSAIYYGGKILYKTTVNPFKYMYEISKKSLQDAIKQMEKDIDCKAYR